MYLTRFRINTARGGARRLLSSPQALHAAVLASFPEQPAGDAPDSDGDRDPARDRPRVLWRVDRNMWGEMFLHIVSPTDPDLTHLVDQAGWSRQLRSDSPGWQTRHYAPFLSQLTRGDSWAFRLTANPVHSVRRKPGEPTKRTAHLTPRHQLRWLLQRQELCGFRLLPRQQPQTERLEERYEVVVHHRRDLSFHKPRDRGSTHKVTLVTATYDGRLEITDPEALRHTLTRGLGKAKAYGCGLMTLSPSLSPTPP